MPSSALSSDRLCTIRLLAGLEQRYPDATVGTGVPGGGAPANAVTCGLHQDDAAGDVVGRRRSLRSFLLAWKRNTPKSNSVMVPPVMLMPL